MRSPAIIEDVTDLGAVRDEWTTLAAAAGNPFLTHEWTTAWWAHRGRGTLRVRLVRDATGHPIAILPLYEHRGRLRLLGHGDSDVAGPVCAPEDLDLAAGALRDAVGVSRLSLFEAVNLPGDQHWPERLGGVVTGREDCPEISLDGRSWDEFLAGRSANFRSEARRRRRGLERDDRLSLTIAETPEEIGPAIDVLFALHRARFGAASQTFDETGAALHREWAASAFAQGWLRLWTLRLDGVPAASLYVFRFGATDWYYQGGRDPRFERERVGFVLLCRAIEDACDAGQATFSLLRGGEDYKRRFADRDPGLVSVRVAGSAAARGVVGAERALLTARRTAGRARRALRARSG